MAGNLVDISHCATGLSIQNSAFFFASAELSFATSFFISCIHRLWDYVRHFLGLCAQIQMSFKPAVYDAGRLRKVLTGGSVRPC